MSETNTTDEDSTEREPQGAAIVAEIEKPAATSEAETTPDAAPAAGASAEAAKSDDEDDAPTELLAPGNPLRWKRGLIAILAGGIPAFSLMAKNGQHGWGIPVGFLFVCVAAFGVMDLLGMFDDQETPTATTTLNALLPSLGAAALSTIAFGGSLALAQAAILPAIAAAFVVPATFLALVASIFAIGKKLGPWRTDELGLDRPLTSRHGFWVIVVGTLLYMPLMGVFSLWDPWETHYGEVAREVLARDDWISLWWAQDGWFWSKPILNFWIQSLAMGSLGTHYQPDMMLIAANGTPAAHAEWVVRAPNVLMTIGAMYLLYKGVAKVFGRRAGLLGAIVLATMPDWFFLAHQTMTDMPFVAAMTAAMGLLLYGLNTDEEVKVRVYEVEAFGTKLTFSLWHLVFGAVLLCAVPQILYLLSRNVELVLFGSGPKGFRIHWDEFRSGSAGNCGLPGNEACSMHSPASVGKAGTPNLLLVRGIAWVLAAGSGAFQLMTRRPGESSSWAGRILTGFLVLLALAATVSADIASDAVRWVTSIQPSLQALVWGGVLGSILYFNWGERRARRLVYIAAWLCAAVATMAKGPAGFGLPIICAFAYVATKKRWSELLRFELVSGLLIILAVALPWYVAMYIRHGSPFTDRLIFHDMFNRAFSHVHDTNEGDDTGIRYYVWQLGYAAFPWTGLVPLGMLWGFRRSDSALARIFGGRTSGTTEGRAAVGDASVLLVMWFLFAFALFTFMGTKFHHYIFPAIPPAAMLVGVVLDDMLGRASMTTEPFGRRVILFGGLGLSSIIATYGASKLLPGSLMGIKPDANATGSLVVALVVGGIGAAIFAALYFLYRDRTDDEADDAAETDEDDRRRKHEQLMLGAATLAGALATVLVGRDLSAKAEGADTAGAIRLLQLFTYNYKRPWPDTLDFSAILTGFTIVAGVLGIALAARALRRHAVLAVCAFSLVWAVWGLDFYMTALSPHWGQHEVIEAYYRDRKSPDELLVAYQMNWKGENFYTGNHIPAFVSSGATFTTWLKKEREKGTKVLYFVTEHGRTSGLKSEVAGKAYKEITDKALCNKFVLVRAEL